MGGHATGGTHTSRCDRSPLVWGGFCQGEPQWPYPFLGREFLSSTWQPVSSPRPANLHRRRAQRRTRMGALARRLVLDGFEHDGTLAVVGMTTFEGSPRVVDELRPHACMRWARGPDHDAVMRIAAKLLYVFRAAPGR